MDPKSKYQPSKKPRLYLDENFPPECISDFFKFDPKHAVLDYGFMQREDIFHYELASKEKRILLTLDRDFENDREFKLAKTFGVVLISVPSPAVPERIKRVSVKLTKFLKSLTRDSLRGCKIFATESGYKVRHIKNGKKIKKHYSW